MTASSVVIVESPAKAKTINKYLGDDYIVLASYGHIRDLPPKDGSVRPDENFAMEWELSDRASKPLDAITKAVKAAQHVYLATDPDREGEAISWHIQEVLKQKKLLSDKRMCSALLSTKSPKARCSRRSRMRVRSIRNWSTPI